MSTAGPELFDALARIQPVADDAPAADLRGRARRGCWLGRGPAVFAGDDRDCLDALCRQVDVRKKVSAGYGPDWKRLDPEVPAEPVVVSGLDRGDAGQCGGRGFPGTRRVAQRRLGPEVHELGVEGVGTA